MLISRRVTGRGDYVRLLAGVSVCIVGYLTGTGCYPDRVHGCTPKADSVGLVTRIWFSSLRTNICLY